MYSFLVHLPGLIFTKNLYCIFASVHQLQHAEKEHEYQPDKHGAFAQEHGNLQDIAGLPQIQRIVEVPVGPPGQPDTDDHGEDILTALENSDGFLLFHIERENTALDMCALLRCHGPAHHIQPDNEEGHQLLNPHQGSLQYIPQHYLIGNNQGERNGTDIADASLHGDQLAVERP